MLVDVYREDTQELVTDHIWLDINKKHLASLTAIKRDSAIRFSARVYQYGEDERYGLQMGNLYIWAFKHKKVTRGEYPQ